MLISGGGKATSSPAVNSTALAVTTDPTSATRSSPAATATKIQGFSDTIGGGTGNFATNSYSTVGGGIDNVASGMSATVAGGGQALSPWRRRRQGKPAAGFGGAGNTASGDYSFVGGGRGNHASGFSSTIAGGDGNAAYA